MKTLITLTLLLLLAGAAAAESASLSLGTGRAPAGQIAWLPVAVHGADVLGVQLDLVVPAAAQVATADGDPLCVVNPAINRNWSHAAYVPAGCTPGEDCTGIRVLTLELSRAIREPIPDGAEVVRCAVRAPDAGALAIGCTRAIVGLSDVLAGADGVRVACGPGTVEAVAGCAVGDLDGSGTITIDEVLGAVEAALGGCR